MVPKTLQKSQQDARDCLISYINAANLLIDMLCLMNDNGDERREYIESKEKEVIKEEDEKNFKDYQNENSFGFFQIFT